MRNVLSISCRHEATAPVIRAECFRIAAGPNLHAAIADHYEFDIAQRCLAEGSAKVVRRALRPVNEYVDPDQVFFCIRTFFDNCFACERFAPAV